MVKLNIVILTSNSMSSNVLYRDLIEKYKDEIKAIIVSSSVSGNLFSRIKKYFKLFRRMSFRFFIYKIIESSVYVNYMRIVNLFSKNDFLMKDLAKRYNIPFLYIKRINDVESINKMKSLNPDLILCYSPPILKKDVIETANKGCLNCHGSLLPDYKGAAQYVWYIINKRKKGGVTLQFMDKEVDEGDIIVQKEFNIEDDDSAYKLHYKIAKAGSELFCNVIELFRNDKVERRKQGKGNYYSIPTKEDMKRFKGKLIRIKDFFRLI